MQKLSKKLITLISLASVSLSTVNVTLASQIPKQLTYNLTNVQVDLSKVQVNQEGKFEVNLNVADAYEISQIGIYDINNIDNSDIAFDFNGLDGGTWDLLDNVLIVDQLPQGENVLEVVAKLKEDNKALANIKYSLENLSVEYITDALIGKGFSFKLVAEKGYRLPQRIAIMPYDSTETPEYTYDNLTGSVTIKALKTDNYGYVKVNASAVNNVAETDFKVKFDLKNVELTEATYGIDEQSTYFVGFSFIPINGYNFPKSGEVGNMRITGIQKDTVIQLASYYKF